MNSEVMNLNNKKYNKNASVFFNDSVITSAVTENLNKNAQKPKDKSFNDVLMAENEIKLQNFTNKVNTKDTETIKDIKSVLQNFTKKFSENSFCSDSKSEIPNYENENLIKLQKKYFKLSMRVKIQGTKMIFKEINRIVKKKKMIGFRHILQSALKR